MHKVVILDDERLAREELKHILGKQHKQLEVVAEFDNPKDALPYFEENDVDLLFLDIEMPEMNGFEFLEQLEDIPHVIFTTAFNEYALEAFKVNALDYLTKPIENEALNRSVTRFIELEKEKPTSNRTKLGLKDKIFIKDGEKVWFLPLSEVRYIKSEGNYARLFFGDQKPMVLRSLNVLEEKLNETDFFRANRQYIIGLNHLKKMENWFNGRLMAVMNDDSKIEISRRQSAKFKDLLSL